MDLGRPSSYLLLTAGTAVYSSDGELIGSVTHVLAAEDEDIFDGIVIREHLVGEEHRFADADHIDEVFERGVVLKLDRAASEQLPKPSPNPAVMRAHPDESATHRLNEKLRRAWDRISGNY